MWQVQATFVIGLVGPLVKPHHHADHGRLPSFAAALPYRSHRLPTSTSARPARSSRVSPLRSNSRGNESSVLEIDGLGGFGGTFAASKCWGRRPCLIRNVFDSGELMGRGEEGERKRRAEVLTRECVGDDASGQRNDDERLGGEPWWPSWCDVVDIAGDGDSESR